MLGVDVRSDGGDGGKELRPAGLRDRLGGGFGLCGGNFDLGAERFLELSSKVCWEFLGLPLGGRVEPRVRTLAAFAAGSPCLSSAWRRRTACRRATEHLAGHEGLCAHKHASG
eukprot:5336376-Pyramimonas_sp.AAC.1